MAQPRLQQLPVRRPEVGDTEAGDQALVLTRKPQCEMTLLGTWDAMGMRGTCSPGYTVAATFDAEQIVPAPFADINAQTMVPWAHILWSSGWLGIATISFALAIGQFVWGAAQPVFGADRFMLAMA